MLLIGALIVIAILTAVGMWKNWGTPTPAQIPIAAIGLVLCVGAFSLAGQRDQNERFNEASIQRDFDTRHAAWVDGDVLFHRCQDAAADRVVAVDKDRAYKIADVEDFSASLIALSDNPGVAAFAEGLEMRRKQSIEDLIPPLKLKTEQAKCDPLNPGPEPVKP